MKTRAQMEISFGMIVSVVLIIAFLSVSFYAIGKFLEIQKTIQIGKFTDNLQFDIDKIWKSSQGSQEFSYSLPTRIQKVCLVDFRKPETGKDSGIYYDLKKSFYGSENLIFYPVGSGGGLDSTILKHIELDKITEIQNPLCFENIGGKTNFTISMEFGENLAIIK